MHWEHVDPPWELPDYVSDLAQALQDMGAWIASGGVVKQVVVVPPPTLPQPAAPSDGESKVGASDAELPSPLQIIPKVRQADDVEHTLDKGLWVGTGAKRQGWRIYIGVSFVCPFSRRPLIDPPCSGSADDACSDMSVVSDPLT